MSELLDSIKQKMDVSLPNFSESFKRTENLLNDSKEFLHGNLKSALDTHTDIVFFGSFARYEVTTESDLDYLIIAYDLPPEGNPNHMRKIIQTVNELCRRLDLNRPGATGMFGTVIAAANLTERIGLEQDTNLSHSRRMLLLQESISVFQPRLHEKLIKSIIERYLADYKNPKDGIPRFLLNDVMRYWRTLTVDYQAKRWNNLNSNWGLRYLKLIISRKLVYAGMLTSIFLTEEATVDWFYQQFSMRSIERIAQLWDKVEEQNQHCVKRILEIADDFIGRISKQDFRDRAKACHSSEEISSDEELKTVKEESEELQKCLEKLFFHDRNFKEKSITYMSF